MSAHTALKYAVVAALIAILTQLGQYLVLFSNSDWSNWQHYVISAIVGCLSAGIAAALPYIEKILPTYTPPSPPAGKA